MFCAAGIDFKIKTIELGGKRIKLQIWYESFFNMSVLVDYMCCALLAMFIV